MGFGRACTALLFLATAQAYAQVGSGPAPQPEHRTVVADFDVHAESISFPNYSVWSESTLPRWAQLAHCTSMALMVRQMHYYARFAPDEPRGDINEVERRIRRIYFKPTARPPEHAAKITIPGFASLFDLSQNYAYAQVLKRAMGDSVFDALNANWHWSPLEILHEDGQSTAAMEDYLKATIDRGRFAILYLTRGTALAHAVTVYGYDEVGPIRRYYAYDSYLPGRGIMVNYDPERRVFIHPTMGEKEGWVLHPYSDMPAPPYPSWLSL
jgi:hypothetical protein